MNQENKTAQKKIKILLVDDDVFLLYKYKQALEARGYEVINARNIDGSNSGIDNFLRYRNSIDIVVSDFDFKMKEYNGCDYIRELRKKLKTDIPVIMHSTEDKGNEAIAAGANAFLTKPNLQDVIGTTHTEDKEIMARITEPLAKEIEELLSKSREGAVRG